MMKNASLTINSTVGEKIIDWSIFIAEVDRGVHGSWSYV